jgi:hypothetical protein
MLTLGALLTLPIEKLKVLLEGSTVSYFEKVSLTIEKHSIGTPNIKSGTSIACFSYATVDSTESPSPQ